MRRLLCVWLPGWPTQRLRRCAAAPDTAPRPLATVESVRGQRRLASLCPLAEAAGLRVEMALAQARAICPELAVADADPAGDRDALVKLAGWAERYTPLAAADPPDGLVLDIAGCAHLFGGEAGLAADLLARLTRQGLQARAAVAGTAAAAWALARWRAEACVLPPGAERAALEALPLGLLRIEARSLAGLRRLGVRSVGELARLPRGEITARFGPEPIRRLDAALGAVTEALVWPHPPAPWQARIAFAEPIGTPEDLTRAIRVLAARLCRRLAAEVKGARRFRAVFLRVDGARPDIAIATAREVRDPAYVARLLAAKLETVDPGFGVDAAVLEADAVAPLAPPQPGLGELAGAQDSDLAATIDALVNRLGARRLWRPAPNPSHVPERSVRPTPPLSAADGWRDLAIPPRPLRLLRRPEPIEAVAPVPDDPPLLFRWRGGLHRVRAAAGPERIAAEWWRRSEAAPEGREEADLVRDYYRVEDSAGARFWLFRIGRDAGAPGARWFLHGLFG